MQYDYVLNFGRKNNISIYKKGLEPIYKKFNITELELYKSDTIFHLATLYNPKPKDLSEKMQIKDANYLFPTELFTQLKKLELKRIITTSSYLQLIPSENQNFYSKTKTDFVNWAKDKFKLTEVFLFDSFGPRDKRDKVLDIFIKKSLKNETIQIPNRRVEINITHVDEISYCLYKSLSLKSGRYMILSKNHFSLKELAQKIIESGKSKSTIEGGFEAENFFDMIKEFPENIYENTMPNDLDGLINDKRYEIKRAIGL